jgi:hypothetical protein
VDANGRGYTYAGENHDKPTLCLPGQAKLCGWTSPTARDHKDGQPNQNVEINGLLGRQVWLTGYPTPTSLSPATDEYNQAGQSCGLHKIRLIFGAVQQSSAPTEKPGALNPAFCRWLMGFPTAWDEYAPTVTRSSRKLQRSL